MIYGIDVSTTVIMSILMSQPRTSIARSTGVDDDIDDVSMANP
jgi:hypothetical protein